MKLYYAETLNPRKACAVATYLKSPVEFVRIDLGKGEHKSPDYLAVNPNGKVPALTDGDVHLWEADAIMAYLARAAGSELWPDDARQVEVIRWLSWSMAHFTRHAGMLYFEHIIKPFFSTAGPDPKVIEEASGYFKQFARVLDDHLRDRAYLVGDAPTIADFSVGVTLPYADAARIPLRGFTHVEAWHDRLNALPGWRDPFPAAPKTAA